MKPESNDFIRFKDMWDICRSHWKWFVFSLAITLSLAFLYIQITPNIYERHVSILLKNMQRVHKEDTNASLSSQDFHVNRTLYDEVESIHSSVIMEKVARRLNLDMNYTMRRRCMYGTNLPIEVKFLDSTAYERVSMSVKLLGNSRVELSDFYNDRIGYTDSRSIEIALSEEVFTPIGRVVVFPTSSYNDNYLPPKAISVVRSPFNIIVDGLLKHFSVEIADDRTSMLNLSIRDQSPQRAQAILDTLVVVYTQNWLDELNTQIDKTTKLINIRLGITQTDLDTLDSGISAYQSQNLIYDIINSSDVYLQQTQAIRSQLTELSSHLSMVVYIRNLLTREEYQSFPLPATMLGSLTLEEQVEKYNLLLDAHNRLLSSGPNHPLIQENNETLASMRESILVALNNLETSIKTSMKDLQISVDNINEHIALIPIHNRYLISLERVQTVKESIYLFLLEMMEEAELSRSRVTSNIQIINNVSGSNIPISPNVDIAFLLAFGMGLFIPFIALFISEITNTKIRSRKDLTGLTIPMLGEIPLVVPHNKLKIIPHKLQIMDPVVKEKSRDLENEAFRIARTNLDFILSSAENKKFVMVSSYNVGSGKSFVTLNLAMSFAIQNRKVLIVDLDMRQATISRYFKAPRRGVTNYLNGTIQDYAPTIIHGRIHDFLDVLPVGLIPPNPAELLSKPRLAELLDELSSSYEYIFMDSPPLEMVADAHLIHKMVPNMVLVLRAGLLDKSILPELEQMYVNNGNAGISMLLNGVTYKHGYYTYRRYGYSYGYGYGRRHPYAYSSDKVEDA